MIDCIILSRTDRYLDRLLQSFDRVGAFGHGRVIVGDNGLDPANRALWPDLLWEKIPQPFNFSGAVNLCVQRTDPTHDLLVLNDDTEWLTPAPHSSSSRGPSSRRRTSASYRPGSSAAWATTTRRKPQTRSRLSRRPICCVGMLIRRQVWEEVGAFDHAFVYYGFEDTDYCRRAVDRGWKLGVAGWIELRHGYPERAASSTYATMYSVPKWSEMGQRAWKLYVEKWGPGPQLGADEQDPA